MPHAAAAVAAAAAAVVWIQLAPNLSDSQVAAIWAA